MNRTQYVRHSRVNRDQADQRLNQLLDRVFLRLRHVQFRHQLPHQLEQHQRQHLGCLHQQNRRDDPGHQDVDRPWVGDLDRRDEHLDRQGERQHLGCHDLLVVKDVKNLVAAEWADQRPTTDAVRLVVAEWADLLVQLGRLGAEAFREEVFRAYAWAACRVDVVLFHLVQVVAQQQWGSDLHWK